MGWIINLGILGLFLIFISIKIIYEYEKGIKFTLGKFSGTLNPGVNFIIPIIQSIRILDQRIVTIDIPPQEVMTKDNVPVSIDAVIYFRVQNAEKAILNVNDYRYAVSKYGQTSLRNVVGGVELDDLLQKREEIAKKLKEIVDIATDPWGIEVVLLELQDVKLPSDLKRVIARQAEAEREKRAAILKAEGEAIAASDLVKASTILDKAEGAIHLRQLAVLSDVSSDKNNKITFYLPFKFFNKVTAKKTPVKRLVK